jgi:hypothetical protein
MNNIDHINQYRYMLAFTRHSLRLSLAVLRCTSIGDVSSVVIIIYFFFVNRYDMDTRQMNMFDGFEYNSNSSCHFLRGKKQNFPFFPLS